MVPLEVYNVLTVLNMFWLREVDDHYLVMDGSRHFITDHVPRSYCIPYCTQAPKIHKNTQCKTLPLKGTGLPRRFLHLQYSGVIRHEIDILLWD